MNHRLIMILLATVIAGGTCLAQTEQPADVNDFKPAFYLFVQRIFRSDSTATTEEPKKRTQIGAELRKSI